MHNNDLAQARFLCAGSSSVRANHIFSALFHYGNSTKGTREVSCPLFRWDLGINILENRVRVEGCAQGLFTDHLLAQTLEFDHVGGQNCLLVTLDYAQVFSDEKERICVKNKVHLLFSS